MLHISDQQLYDAFDTASPKIAEYIVGDSINQTVATLGKIHHIPLEHFVTLKNIIVYTLLDLLPKESLGVTLLEECSVHPEDVDVLLVEMFSVLSDAGVLASGLQENNVRTIAPETTATMGAPSLDELRKQMSPGYERQNIDPKPVEPLQNNAFLAQESEPRSIALVPPQIPADIPAYASPELPKGSLETLHAQQLADIVEAGNQFTNAHSTPIVTSAVITMPSAQQVAEIPVKTNPTPSSTQNVASPAPKPSPLSPPQSSVNGTRASLMDKLSLLQTVPDEDTIEERIRKISEYSSQTQAQDAEDASGALPIVPATARPIPTEKPPEKYTVDPYRELPEGE